MTRWLPHFSEWFHYDITRDADVCRVSIADPAGREFFAVVPTDGKGYRDRRDDAVSAILTAIEAGDEPGEVSVQFERAD